MKQADAAADQNGQGAGHARGVAAAYQFADDGQVQQFEMKLKAQRFLLQGSLNTEAADHQDRDQVQPGGSEEIAECDQCAGEER